MRLTMLPMIAGLAGAAMQPSALAQDKREIKASERADEQAARRRELLEEIRPHADRFAGSKVAGTYSDALVRGYVNALGQSLVPQDTPAATTFSFRVVNDIYPNASALPDGRIYLTTGMLAHVENEAQLAMVLGHEIAHVIEEHTLESIRRRRSGQRRNKIIGVATGAALGGILGGKKGGANAAAQGIALGAAGGFLISSALNSALRSRYSKEQEMEADSMGTKLALELGFDPNEAVRFWERQNERFGKRSLRSRTAHSLFGSHPSDRVRAASLRVLLAKDLKPEIDAKRQSGALTTGTEQFGSVISGLMRDTGALIGERSDRHDLAARLLERARKYRPNDPRLLWALGRTYLTVGRTAEKRQEAESLLLQAIERDQRRLYPAIHRDLAYALASRGASGESVTRHLKRYVLGNLAIHHSLPSDIDDVYDKMVLFGENSWLPEAAARKTPLKPDQSAAHTEEEPSRAAGTSYHPTVWDTPADLAAYDHAIQMSAAQIETSFGGAPVASESNSE